MQVIFTVHYESEKTIIPSVWASPSSRPRLWCTCRQWRKQTLPRLEDRFLEISWKMSTFQIAKVIVTHMEIDFFVINLANKILCVTLHLILSNKMKIGATYAAMKIDVVPSSCRRLREMLIFERNLSMYPTAMKRHSWLTRYSSATSTSQSTRIDLMWCVMSSWRSM